MSVLSEQAMLFSVKQVRDKDQSSSLSTHLKTEPLFSHHIRVYTSCKPTLQWPRPFVNTCILVLLLIRHTNIDRYKFLTMSSLPEQQP